MLKSYKGRLISSVEAVTNSTYASSIWSLEEHMQNVNASTWPIITPAAPPGQVNFTTPGTYTWVVPIGVSSVSVVVIGGGGGGGSSGGGLSSTAGGTSYFKNTGTVAAGGGQPGDTGSTGPAGGVVIAGTAGTNGSNAPNRVNSFLAQGGGGAGLLNGLTAPNGAEFNWGGSGGSGSSLTSSIANNGGGGSNSAEAKGGVGGTFGGGGGGGRDGMGGSGGAIAYVNNLTVAFGESLIVVVGAGGIGQNSDNPSQRGGGSGGPGAVRIIWPGLLRFYPSTRITDE